MLFVEICVNSLCIFFSFNLDCFPVLVPKRRFVILVSNIILFQISTFIFSCVSGCSVVFGGVVFRLLFLGVSDWLEGSGFSVFSLSVTVSGLLFFTCFPIYLLVYFQYFKVRKPTFLYYRPNLVSYSLVCHKSSAFFLDFNHFLPSLCRFAPKITVKCKYVVFPSSFLALKSLVRVVA